MYDANENKFIDLSYGLYYFINYMKDNVPYRKSSLFGEGLDNLGNTNKDVIRKIYDINEAYNSIKNNVLGTRSSAWELVVRDYAYFLKNMEKVFFYFNDKDESKIYANIDSLHDDLSLTINTDDYTITYTFKDSSINVPGVTIDATDDPLGFMKEEVPKSQSTVLFIELDIVRNFGRREDQNYKFIYNSTNQFKDKSDEMLVSVAKNVVSGVIIDNLDDILNNAIYDYTTRENSNLWTRNEVLKKFDFFKKE